MESSKGLFTNRNYSYSALRRNASVDNYTETVIPIDIPSGTLSFKVETHLTHSINEDYKFIKDVADGEVEWDTVAVNFAEGQGPIATLQTRMRMSRSGSALTL